MLLVVILLILARHFIKRPEQMTITTEHFSGQFLSKSKVFLFHIQIEMFLLPVETSVGRYMLTYSELMMTNVIIEQRRGLLQATPHLSLVQRRSTCNVTQKPLLVKDTSQVGYEKLNVLQS